MAFETFRIFIFGFGFVLAIRIGCTRLELKRQGRQLNCIMSHLGLTEASAFPQASTTVKSMVSSGNIIEAIKQYREETGSGLKDANNAIKAIAADVSSNRNSYSASSRHGD